MNRSIVPTRPEFFDSLEREFHFTLDPCALPENAKAARYFTPSIDGLSQPWHGRVYMNPPYEWRQVGRWMAKACSEYEAGRAELVVCLVHAGTSTSWWHDYVEGHATELRFLRGRGRYFVHPAGPDFRPRFEPCLVIYGSVDRPRGWNRCSDSAAVAVAGGGLVNSLISHRGPAIRKAGA